MASTIALAGENTDAFMQRLTSIPLLDNQTTLELAALIQQGQAQSKHIPKTKAAMAKAARIVKAGDAARTRLVFHNLRFAAWAARQSMGYKQTSDREFIREVRPKGKEDKRNSIDALKELAHYPLPLADRIQETVLGLILAADRYVPSGQAKFTTLAAYYIVRQLRQEVLGDHFRDSFSRTTVVGLLRVMAAQHKLRRLTGQEPNEEMIASDINAEDTTNAVGQRAIGFRIEEAILYAKRSLEEIDHELYRYDPATGEWLDLADILQDNDLLDAFEYTQFNALGNALEDIFDSLSEREAGVVSLRFGVTNGRLPLTLDEIGKVYGVSRERIRQIENKTMSKLRHPSRSDLLRGFLDDDWEPHRRRPRNPERYVRDRHNSPELYDFDHPSLRVDTTKPSD
jgi:RNA polymerase primary sigma factor